MAREPGGQLAGRSIPERFIRGKIDAGAGVCAAGADADTTRTSTPTATPTNTATPTTTRPPATPTPGSTTKKVYWTDGTDTIAAIGADGTGQSTLVTNAAQPSGIAFDPVNNYIYWADRQTNKLRRMNLDGSNPVDIFSVDTLAGVSAPVDLMVDPALELADLAHPADERASRTRYLQPHLWARNHHHHSA